MKKYNIEALKSSVLVGLSFGAITCGSLLLTHNPYYFELGCVALCLGFLVGLLTTWYPDEE